MLEIVTFKWKPQQFYRSKFKAEHVNTLAAMVKRNYNKPHRFSCITDDAEGIDSSIRIIPLWSDYCKLPSAYGSRNPSCYRRLKLFSSEMKEVIGERFVSLDLDLVITGDLSPLFDRTEDIVLLKSPTPPPRYLYNGSMLMMTAGCRTKIWEEFDPKTSPRETISKKFFGSDQAWISMKLGPGEAMWSEDDGVYSYRIHLFNKSKLPDNSRIVSFHGSDDPWGVRAQQLEWVRQNYAN